MDYLFVYIKQAHSEDWPIGSWSNKPQPTTLKERIKRGMRFKTEYNIKMPMYFDDFSDSFNEEMGAWPLRMYVLDVSGKVLYIEPDPPEGVEIYTRLENLLGWKYDELGIKENQS